MARTRLVRNTTELDAISQVRGDRNYTLRSTRRAQTLWIVQLDRISLANDAILLLKDSASCPRSEGSFRLVTSGLSGGPNCLLPFNIFFVGCGRSSFVEHSRGQVWHVYSNTAIFDRVSVRLQWWIVLKDHFTIQFTIFLHSATSCSLVQVFV